MEQGTKAEEFETEVGKASTETTDSLDEFDGWEEGATAQDFLFGEGFDKPVNQEDIEKEDKERLEALEKAEKDLFETPDDEDEEEVDEDNMFKTDPLIDKDKDKPASTKVSAVKMLKEKGFLDFELSEGEELTEESAEEYLEQGYEKGIEGRVEELLKGMPSIVKDIVDIASKGGDVNTYLDILKAPGKGINENMDMTDEANQIMMVRTQLALEDYDEDYIDSQIEYLKDSGKLESISGKHFNKWKAGYAKEKENIKLAAEERKTQEKETMKAMKKSVIDTLKGKDNLDGISFNKKDVDVLPTYMTAKTVKTKNGTYITELQSALYAALNDTVKATKLAKILREDFDLKDTVKNIEKKVTDKARAGIQTGQGLRATGDSQKPKSLSDYFDENR